MVRGLADVEEVVHHTAHHVARVHAVEVCEAEALVLVEKILPHARLHACAHDVTLCGNEVAAAHAHKVHRHKSKGDHAERSHDRVRALKEEPAGERAQNHGKRKVDAGDDERTHGVCDEEAALRTVIRQEAAKHGGAEILRCAHKTPFTWLWIAAHQYIPPSLIARRTGLRRFPHAPIRDDERSYK